MKTDDKSVRVGVYVDSPWTLTHSGIKLIYLEPTVEMISLDDICHSTANLCRFTGAMSQFYSVAQHSMMVGSLVKTIIEADEAGDFQEGTVPYWNQILAGLLHDSSEAYINDLASPLKVAIKGEYERIEHGLLSKVFEKFDVPMKMMNQTVKKADNIALQIERYYFMPDHPEWPKVPDDEMFFDRPRFIDPISASKLFREAIENALRKREVSK